jgi:hypothetical protein
VRAALLGLAACVSSTPDLTLIDRLQVIALVAEPPEVGPGEHLRLTTHVLDPERAAFDVLMWFCTDLGDGCAERGDPGLPLSAFARVVRDADRAAGVSFLVPPQVGEVLGGSVRVTTFVGWALACRPGSCPILDEVEADPAPNSPAWEATVAALAVPRDLVLGRSLDEASLAYRRLTLSIRSFEERNMNPILRFEGVRPIEVQAGRSLRLVFDVFDGAIANPYSSTGGFERSSYVVNSGELLANWTAPEQPGLSELVVVVDDALGGAAVWQVDATVTRPD